MVEAPDLGCREIKVVVISQRRFRFQMLKGSQLVPLESPAFLVGRQLDHWRRIGRVDERTADLVGGGRELLDVLIEYRVPVGEADLDDLERIVVDEEVAIDLVDHSAPSPSGHHVHRRC